MPIPVRWHEGEIARLPHQENTVFVIQHGGTFYVYVNTGRAEAERRFQASIEEQGAQLTAADGATAVGMETPFSDEFVLWANASEHLRSHAEDLMRQIMGGAQS